MKRSVRQFALAALPLVVLGQCAPTCTPQPPPPLPPSVTYTDMTASVPGDAVVYDISGGAGRYLTLGGFGADIRLDLTTRTAALFPMPGVLTPDGEGIVGALDERTVAYAPFASGQPIASVSLPAGWELSAVTSASNGGIFAGVEAVNGAFADQAAFLVDLSSRTATKLDTALAPDTTGHDSYFPLVNAGGASVAAFTFRDGPVGCTGCEDVWAWQRSGPLELVSVAPNGGSPTTGASDVVDVSADGRYVLFSSTSTDLAGGPAHQHPNARLLVRDLMADTTSGLGDPTVLGGVDALNAAISDDGDRIAFATRQAVTRNGARFVATFPAVYDRSAGTTTVLARANSADDDLSFLSAITLSGDGRRVAYTTIDTGGTPHHIVADLTGG